MSSSLSTVSAWRSRRRSVQVGGSPCKCCWNKKEGVQHSCCSMASIPYFRWESSSTDSDWSTGLPRALLLSSAEPENCCWTSSSIPWCQREGRQHPVECCSLLNRSAANTEVWGNSKKESIHISFCYRLFQPHESQWQTQPLYFPGEKTDAQEGIFWTQCQAWK